MSWSRGDIALEQINEAVDDLEHGRILGRAIITYT